MKWTIKLYTTYLVPSYTPGYVEIQKYVLE
jgi:hypothetical protein